jgi:hypothetical protein
MTTKRYQKRMKQHEDSFDKLWKKIVSDTNEFNKDNPEKTMYSLNNIQKFCDSLCLSGAWIQDTINGYIGTTNSTTYKKTLTKKIRKALGFFY